MTGRSGPMRHRMVTTGRIDCVNCGAEVRAHTDAKANGVVSARLCWKCYRHKRRHRSLPKQTTEIVTVEVQISAEQARRLRRLRRDPLTRSVLTSVAAVILGESFGAAIDRVWKGLDGTASDDSGR